MTMDKKWLRMLNNVITVENLLLITKKANVVVGFRVGR